jgi:lysozyme
MGHRTSNTGLQLIKEHEGLRLVAYRDPVGVWTIGYGHTTNVYPGMFISNERAVTLLLQDVQQAERCIQREVKVPLTQTMFDALVSFVFNLGCGAFRSSTILGLLNEGNYLPAADQFPRWVRAGGRVLPGLVRRRALEQGLFLSELSLIHNFIAGEIHETSRVEAAGSYHLGGRPNITGTDTGNQPLA